MPDILTVNVSLKDVDVYEKLVNILRTITEDQRIDENIRNEYTEQIKTLFE